MTGPVLKVEPLAILAHELRSPIGAIRNAVSLMESAGRSPVAMDQAKRIIARQAGQLAVLVDDLLDFASATHGTLNLRPCWVDVVEEVEAAVEACAWALTASGHALVVELPQRPVRAFLDGTRLRQIVTNLLDNACKYTPAYGRIRLCLETAEGFIVLVVEDNGAGISSERLPHVFDLFVRSPDTERPAVRGLGVGLALVREIAQLHGGEVQAVSQGIGRGSAFIVRLPA
jgi:signal transduction histidine kinase